MPEAPATLGQNRELFGAQFSASNTLLIPQTPQPQIVYEDCEDERLWLNWRRGLDNRTDLSVELPIVWRNGGFMDDVLTAFHRLTGIGTVDPDDFVGRDSVRKYQARLLLVDPSGRTLVDSAAAFGPGDASLYVKRRLAHSFSVRAGLKIPTGNQRRLLGSGSLDAGLALDGSFTVGRDFTVYGTAGAATLGHASIVPRARWLLWQYVLSVEYHPNSRDSFYWQFDGSPSAVHTGNRFADGTQGTALFGYRRRLDNTRSLYAAFAENGDIHDFKIPVFSNVGPDFTVTIGMEWRK